MILENFPRELYRLTFRHLSQTIDSKSLITLCLVSTIFRADAEAFLYEQVVDLDFPNQMLLHHTVTTVPRLARLVRHYEYYDERANLFQNTISAEQDMNRQLWGVHIPEMLRAFTNLKTLILKRRGGDSCADVLTGCQFKLDRLGWGSLHWETQLMTFLETQPQLIELDIFWRADMPNPSPDILQKLRRFAASNSYTVAAFLPDRTIQHLEWRLNRFDKHEHVILTEMSKYPGVADAFRYLTSLCVSSFFPASGFSFEALIPFLPRLIALEVTGGTILSIQSVKDLPALRGLLLIGPYFPLNDLEDRKKLVDGIFAQNVKLELIFVLIKMDIHRRSELWELRAESNPTRIVHLDDARSILKDMACIL
ncbi:hypothetical protein DL96DRAFT_1677513 [Flagelloscypha sp. PMI_526]|nr:hypothetical protein DL96DRAFT_1677513 [Flagelloscypha sp. PMI_526]